MNSKPIFLLGCLTKLINIANFVGYGTERAVAYPIKSLWKKKTSEIWLF
jgi:hypothetical protein